MKGLALACQALAWTPLFAGLSYTCVDATTQTTTASTKTTTITQTFTAGPLWPQARFGWAQCASQEWLGRKTHNDLLVHQTAVVKIQFDAQGSMYLATGTEVPLDGQNVSGLIDVVLLKYDADGKWLWTVLWGCSGAELLFENMNLGHAGDIILSGFATGRGGTCSGGGNLDRGGCFVIKFDQDGRWQWTQTTGWGSDLRCGEARSDLAGAVYLVGWPNHTEMVLSKLSSAGSWVWTRRRSGRGLAVPWVLPSTSGDVYVVGAIFGSMDNQTYSGASSDLFLVKYNGQGEWQWTRQHGSDSRDWLGRPILDEEGNILMSGTTGGALPGHTASSNSSSIADPFLLKYDGMGNLLWTLQYPVGADHAHFLGVGADHYFSTLQLASTAAGDILLVFKLYSSFGYVVCLDSAGAWRWTATSEDVAESIESVALSPSGNVYLAGRHSDNIWGARLPLYWSILATNDVYAVADQVECQADAVTSGHQFYDFNELLGQCWTGAACPSTRPAEGGWSIHQEPPRSRDIAWYALGVGTSCTPGFSMITKVAVCLEAANNISSPSPMNFTFTDVSDLPVGALHSLPGCSVQQGLASEVPSVFFNAAAGGQGLLGIPNDTSAICLRSAEPPEAIDVVSPGQQPGLSGLYLLDVFSTRSRGYPVWTAAEVNYSLHFVRDGDEGGSRWVVGDLESNFDGALLSSGLASLQTMPYQAPGVWRYKSGGDWVEEAGILIIPRSTTTTTTTRTSTSTSSTRTSSTSSSSSTHTVTTLTATASTSTWTTATATTSTQSTSTLTSSTATTQTLTTWTATFTTTGTRTETTTSSSSTSKTATRTTLTTSTSSWTSTTSSSTTFATVLEFTCGGPQAVRVFSGLAGTGLAWHFCPNSTGQYGFGFSRRLTLELTGGSWSWTYWRTSRFSFQVRSRDVGVCRTLSPQSPSPGSWEQLDVWLTCCPDEAALQSCSGRGTQAFVQWGVHHSSSFCLCHSRCTWPWSGSRCQDCRRGFVPVTSAKGQEECADCVAGLVPRQQALAFSGATVWFDFPSPTLCQKLARVWSWRCRLQYAASSSGLGLTVPDSPHPTQCNLYVASFFLATVSSVPRLACPSVTLQNWQTLPSSSPSATHIHLLDTGRSNLILAMQVINLLHNVVLELRAPALLGNSTLWWSTLHSTSLVVVETLEQLQFMVNNALALARRSHCGFSQVERDLLGPEATPAPRALLVLVGELSCSGSEDADTMVQLRSHGVPVIWFANQEGLLGPSVRIQPSSRPEHTFCEALARMEESRAGCREGALSFQPAVVPPMRRVRLTFRGICSLQACCFGGRCSTHAGSRGGLHWCYTPLLDSDEELVVSVVTRANNKLNASQPLSLRIHGWVSYNWMQPMANPMADRPRQLSVSRDPLSHRCYQFIAIGVHEFEVLGAVAPPQCNPRSSGRWVTIDVPSAIEHTQPFARAARSVALRSYQWLPGAASWTRADGRSALPPAIEGDVEEASAGEETTGWQLPRPWYTEQIVTRYVAHLLSRILELPRGAATEAVRLALASVQLYSGFPPEERSCTAADTPDVDGLCYWAWTAHASGAVPHLQSAGFDCAQISWNAFLAHRVVVGDIVVLPGFEALVDDTNLTLQFPDGDIAVRHNASSPKPWVADALRSFAWLRNVTIGPGAEVPTLCRLTSHPGLWPEEGEEVVPTPVLPDVIRPNSSAAQEALAQWLGLDLANPALEDAVRTIQERFPCPMIWEQGTALPRQLSQIPGQTQAVWRRNEPFRCLTMRPTPGRNSGVNCCYDPENRYIPSFPSRTLFEPSPLLSRQHWRQLEEDSMAQIARGRDSGSHSRTLLEPSPFLSRQHWRQLEEDGMGQPVQNCDKTKDMPLEVQMAALAVGVYDASPGMAARWGWRVAYRLCQEHLLWRDCALVYKKHGGYCAVAFKGTELDKGDLRDMWDNGYAFTGTLDKRKLDVHKGFLKEYTSYTRAGYYSLWEAELQDTRSTACAIVGITGHSLGGAVATLHFLDVGLDLPHVTLFAFGAPRVLRSWDHHIPCSSGRAFRYVMTKDASPFATPDTVTVLPPGGSWTSYGSEEILVRGTAERRSPGCHKGTRCDRDSFGIRDFGSADCGLAGFALHSSKYYLESLLLSAEISHSRRFRSDKDDDGLCHLPAPPGTNMPIDPEFGWQQRPPRGRFRGDPHCVSFDGTSFECNFEGEAVYDTCQDWRIHVATQRVGDGGGTVVVAIAVQKGLDIVTVDLRQPALPDEIGLDGENTSLGAHYIILLNEEEVESSAGGAELTVVLSGGSVAIEATKVDDLEVSLVLRPTFISMVQLAPGQRCWEETGGLLGSWNGNTTDDLWPRNASQPLPPSSTCREIYNTFVLSWCITDLSDSLLGPNHLCNDTFAPACGDELQAEVMTQCPTGCNGRTDCCFDQFVSNEDAMLMAADVEDAETLASQEALSSSSAPSFTEATAQVFVTPPDGSQERRRLAVFEAVHQVAVANLTCSVCDPEAVSEAFQVLCNMTGEGTGTARLELWAVSLPEGDTLCEAADDFGGRTAVLLRVGRQTSTTRTDTTSVSTATVSVTVSSAAEAGGPRSTTEGMAATSTSTASTSTSTTSSSASGGPSGSSTDNPALVYALICAAVACGIGVLICTVMCTRRLFRASGHRPRDGEELIGSV